MTVAFFKSLLRSFYDVTLPRQQLLFNRYRVHSVLGMGSYGITYKAYDCSTQNYVAIKHLRKSKACRAVHRKAFHQEYETLRSLPQSPSFPSVHGEYYCDDGYFLIMDFMEGTTFEDLVFRDGMIYSEEDTVKLLNKLLSLTDLFHNEGIVHRDLRLPNILYHNHRLSIIDFGLATSVSKASTKFSKKHPMRTQDITSDFYNLGHFSLFLLYSNYEPTSQLERSWEEELTLTPLVHQMIRRLLQIDAPYRTSQELRNDIARYDSKKTT
ncbi:protein kinase domain protein [Fictibacillus macauensis ZFHKF-1]|uniref:Protein kinase domain protein n=1 Tax=Fictibacillus macauensis ZFHKF-1 TaxID=1196324 RepID=I8UFU5_9BACL|nr:protein kinase [Fictibacillus macauensis]EIT85693.1 protein kinase domain protein [Fictibacillus macauensis ZFHKF-1]